MLDTGAMAAAQTELGACGRSRSVGHARQLRAIVVLHGVLGRARAGDSTVAEVALLLSVSEVAARGLLDQAVLLCSLPGGVEAVEAGLLGIEQAALLTRRLRPLTPEVQRAVWARVLVRLQADVDEGVVRPPARLGELLSAWIIKVDPAGATARRRRAGAGRGGRLPPARGRAGGSVRVRDPGGAAAGDPAQGPGVVPAVRRGRSAAGRAAPGRRAGRPAAGPPPARRRARR